jgi:transposase-like protein
MVKLRKLGESLKTPTKGKPTKPKRALTGKYRYTPEERLKAVAGYKKSGKELRVYAREIGIPRETLRCWVIGKYSVSPVYKKASTNARTTKKTNTKK